MKPWFLKLVSASFFVASSVAASGCAMDATADSEEEIPAEATSDELHALGARFVGDYQWVAPESGDFVDFEELSLQADGTYNALTEATYVQPGVRCRRAPCTLPEQGRWNAYRAGWQTRILVRPANGKAWRVYTVAKRPGSLLLSRFGQVTKLYQPESACASVLCPTNTTCSMKVTNGRLGAVCEPTEPPPPPPANCFKTGCSGHVCADQDVITTCEFRPEYACYQAATCERQPDGRCGFTPSPALSACLAGN
jgi:hypothetical protein